MHHPITSTFNFSKYWVQFMDWTAIHYEIASYKIPIKIHDVKVFTHEFSKTNNDCAFWYWLIIFTSKLCNVSVLYNEFFHNNLAWSSFFFFFGVCNTWLFILKLFAVMKKMYSRIVRDESCQSTAYRLICNQIVLKRFSIISFVCWKQN